MLYWEGPLPTHEQAIELRRRNLRDALIAYDFLAEALPLLHALPEVGDSFVTMITSHGWETMPSELLNALSTMWPENPPEAQAVRDCLTQFQARQSIPRCWHPKLCSPEELEMFD